MGRLTAVLLLIGLSISGLSMGPELGTTRMQDWRYEARTQIVVVLDVWHGAAARGNANDYFQRMTSDAVFLGTDRTERWTRAEFEAFARPYFDGTEAWTYTPTERHVDFPEAPARGHDEPSIGWIDEVLWNEKYGYCRGTGVLEYNRHSGWRIAHYSLSFLVPNDSSAAVMEAIGPQPRPAAD